MIQAYEITPHAMSGFYPFYIVFGREEITS